MSEESRVNLNISEIESLRNQMTEYVHYNAMEKPFTLIDWQIVGRPYMWRIVEEYNGQYFLALDIAHGYMALLKNNRCVSWGKNYVQHDNVVGLDKDYYGVNNYLFVSAS